MTLQTASTAKTTSDSNTSTSDISDSQLMTEINSVISSASSDGKYATKIKMENYHNGAHKVDYNNAGQQLLSSVVNTLQINGYRVKEIDRGDRLELNIGWDYE